MMRRWDGQTTKHTGSLSSFYHRHLTSSSNFEINPATFLASAQTSPFQRKQETPARASNFELTSGLKIMDSRSPVMMMGQIPFSPDKQCYRAKRTKRQLYGKYYKRSHPKMTGQNDRQDESLTGQVHDQVRHCPPTSRYFDPCI